MKVAVIGGAGYAGGELLRLLLQHPEVRELVVTSRSQAGKPIAEVHPTLTLLTDARFAAHDPAGVAEGKDVVFLALEHGESTAMMGRIIDSAPGLIVDLAADFRIQDGALHAAHYGLHQAPELVHHFRYGLADLQGTALRGARAIAAPGCFATTAQLALSLIADRELLSPPVLFAVTGSSGAGQKLRTTTHHPARAHNLFAYPGFGHRHEGEILEQWRSWRGDPQAMARMIPHSGPFVRGIHLTLHARLGEGLRAVTGLPRRAEHSPFVRLLDTPPQLTHAVGSNLALLHLDQSPDGTEVVVTCVTDNLIKGAGGQGIQAMNLALGLEERTGLLAPGVFPC